MKELLKKAGDKLLGCILDFVGWFLWTGGMLKLVEI